MTGDLHPRMLAHLGDAVYELRVRELAVELCGHQKLDDLHRFTTQRVQATFQAQLLDILMPDLTEAEQTMVRQARNIPTTARRRSDQQSHRQATALEALIGALYRDNPERLQELWQRLEPYFTAGAIDLSSDARPGRSH